MKPTVIGRAVGLMVLAFPWLGAQACSAVSQRSGTPEALVAFVNVTVIPMDSPGALPNHTVLVEDGSIMRVGPAADIPVPAGAHVIDAAGRFLIPGSHVQRHAARLR